MPNCGLPRRRLHKLQVAQNCSEAARVGRCSCVRTRCYVSSASLQSVRLDKTGAAPQSLAVEKNEVLLFQIKTHGRACRDLQKVGNVSTIHPHTADGNRARLAREAFGLGPRRSSERVSCRDVRGGRAKPGHSMTELRVSISRVRFLAGGR